MPATKREYVDSSDNWSQLYGSEWKATLFTTPGTGHTVKSIKLNIFRYGSPGIVTVSIRATSGGVPTGPDLASGTINGDDLTTSTGGELKEITMGTEILLSAGTTYAIVVRCAGTDGTHALGLRYDGSSPPSPSSAYSVNSGSSWTSYGGLVTYDFEVWGNDTLPFPNSNFLILF